ncbi:MAG: pyridoxamine 5'-phosphate oxidase family protein [Desulfobacterota bacterium]|nr:pyridoxamine 5'-phosphate oxidase family protein [Thermodesulfobacteriota bacterium]
MDPRDTMETAYDRRLAQDFVKKLKGRIKKLDPEALRRRIVRFLEENVICTLATCSNNEPRSTIVRYCSRDLTVYVLTEGGGKVKNIKENPLVSLSVCGPYDGFQSVMGLQAWGTAELIAPRDGERYYAIRKEINPEAREDLKQAGVQKVPDMYIIKIQITRARFLSFPEGIINQVYTTA